MGVHHNIRVYSIFYAFHVPHKKNTNPILCAVSDNLSKIYIPNLDEKTRRDDFFDNDYEVEDMSHNITYYFYNPTISCTLSKSNYLELCPASSFYGPFPRSAKYAITYTHSENEGVSICFDSEGRLLQVAEMDKNNAFTLKLQMTPNILKQTKNYEEILYGNIVQERKRPIVNLQWLYNWLNYKRFNS